MSRGIAGYTAKHRRTLSLIVAAIGIGAVGAYLAYPYSSAERQLLAKIGRTAEATGLSEMFVWAAPNSGH